MLLSNQNLRYVIYIIAKTSRAVLSLKYCFHFQCQIGDLSMWSTDYRLRDIQQGPQRSLSNDAIRLAEMSPDTKCYHQTESSHGTCWPTDKHDSFILVYSTRADESASIATQQNIGSHVRVDQLRFDHQFMVNTNRIVQTRFPVTRMILIRQSPTPGNSIITLRLCHVYNLTLELASFVMITYRDLSLSGERYED